MIKSIPPYGQRSGWIPKKQEDFGDGGAFPEIHIAQYPLGMGKNVISDGNSSQNSSIVPLKTDSQGNIRYDSIVHYGRSSDVVVHSRPIDSMGRYYTQDELQRPDEKVESKITEITKRALEEKLNSKIGCRNASQAPSNINPNPTSQFIRYTPANQNNQSSTSQKIIRLVEKPVDPLEPAKFRAKKVPRGPPSPPAPVLHSPPRKPTKEERENWIIPPCISNWKNNKGLTIELDKRLASDGRGLQEHTLNPNFAKFAEVLYATEKHTREEITYRTKVQQTLAMEEKKRKDQELLEYARKARMERLGILNEAREKETYEERRLRIEREELLEERRRERERESRLERMRGRNRERAMERIQSSGLSSE